MIRPSFVLHSHFYQPPREDPWTDRVPVEPSAAPYHDWNERILAECYAPVTAARVLDGEGRIRDVLNTLEWTSWDAGPTLVRWLAKEAPATYRAFLEADARSSGRLGFGNALAAPYHHVILPLASRRDKVTEVRWGMADFRRRFGRDPEGMWLPETAVDTETLEVLAEEGILFTVLAPGQVETPPLGGLPGRVQLGRGRSIAVFVYDGALSHGVAFGSLLGNAEAWIRQVTQTAGQPGRRLVSIATDGETFGHHHRWSDMALAATLSGLEGQGKVRVENFASFLDRFPPVEDVTLVEPSSWSCAHGVDRWRRECGCKMAPQLESQQAWRAVLRDALNELSGALHGLFETEGRVLFEDPWAARDGYGAVLDGGDAAVERYVTARARGHLQPTEAARARDLLEIERDALRMFTSCGWFFDDLAGLEPLQVLRYAAHALELAGPPGLPWATSFVSALAEARSNDPEAGDGRRLWNERVLPGGFRDSSSLGANASDEPEKKAAQAAEGVLARLGVEVSDAGGELTDAVRQFLRAPGEAAARMVAASLFRFKERGASDLTDAQTLFAHGVPRGPGRPPEPVLSVARSLGFGSAFFEPRAIGGKEPVGFVFGLHLHQPVGNFDDVFLSHTEDVYLPFLQRLEERGLLPLTLHVSGPLLEWLDGRDHRFLDLVGRMAAEGSLELMLSGFYEPVLPALSRDDRVEQIGWMREWLSSRFGVDATGLWLTERVWEPDLAEDLEAAGVRYALVDDRHFLVAGFERPELHRPHRTESGGRSLSLLPIDERLRYLIPFRPPSELAAYLRALRANDHELAVLADDGEKFGGWPGTAEWVWRSGWLDDFLGTMTGLVEDGVVRMTTAGDAVEDVPHAGPSYLPSASYREMEHWALPPAAALELEGLERALAGTSPAARAAERFVRGGHWRNFFATYSESNRMHAKAQLLSTLCRRKGDPPAARRAIGRAQCNDTYWHGVFGGLYLRHLREAVWANLADAEAVLREGQRLDVELADVDGDGRPELWVHSELLSCVVSPHRGGAVTELIRFAERRNLADVLTRRWESYHRSAAPPSAAQKRGNEGNEHANDGGMPSIHDLEERLSFVELPPFDAATRALTVERVLSHDLRPTAYERAAYDPLATWAHANMDVAYEVGVEAAVLHLTAEGPGALEKRVRIHADGSLEIMYRWDPGAFPPEARFAPELSLSAEAALSLEPTPEDVWRYEIRTVSKSEQGSEESVQGLSVTPLWPCRVGEATLRVGAIVDGRADAGREVAS